MTTTFWSYECRDQGNDKIVNLRCRLYSAAPDFRLEMIDVKFPVAWKSLTRPIFSEINRILPFLDISNLDVSTRFFTIYTAFYCLFRRVEFYIFLTNCTLD